VGPHREVYAGRFQSFDRGRTWRGFAAPRGDFGGLAAGPSRAVLLIASWSRGVLRSSDAGATWSAARGVRASPVQALAIDPADPRHLVAYDWARGLVSTRDDGGTWTGARCLTPGACAVQFYLPFFLGVAVDPFDPAIVYVASADGFRRSPDGGRSLARILPAGVGCLQFQSFAPDPWTPGTLYASGFLGDSCDPGADFCSAFVSRDRGDTWDCLPLADAQKIVAAPSHPGTLYATAEGLPQEGTTVRVSHDGGVSWSLLAEVPQFTALAVDPSDDQRLLAAANEGYWRSRDGGATWTQVLDGQLIGEGLVGLDGHDPNLLIVADPDHGVRWSRDDGGTWQSLPPTDVLGTLGHSYPSLLVDSSRAGRIFLLGGSGVDRTTLPPR